MIRGQVMATFTPTNIYQRKRDFARQVLAVFNAEHFRPVRVYLFKAKYDFAGERQSLCESAQPEYIRMSASRLGQRESPFRQSMSFTDLKMEDLRSKE